MKIVIILAVTIVCLASFLDANHRWGKRQVKEWAFSEERLADGYIQEIVERIIDYSERKLGVRLAWAQAISYRSRLKRKNVFLVKANCEDFYTREKFPVHMIIVTEPGPTKALAVKEVCEDDELVPFEED